MGEEVSITEKEILQCIKAIHNDYASNTDYTKFLERCIIGLSNVLNFTNDFLKHIGIMEEVNEMIVKKAKKMPHFKYGAKIYNYLNDYAIKMVEKKIKGGK